MANRKKATEMGYLSLRLPRVLIDTLREAHEDPLTQKPKFDYTNKVATALFTDYLQRHKVAVESSQSMDAAEIYEIHLDRHPRASRADVVKAIKAALDALDTELFTPTQIKHHMEGLV
jgi:hypothetical protein